MLTLNSYYAIATFLAKSKPLIAGGQPIDCAKRTQWEADCLAVAESLFEGPEYLAGRDYYRQEFLKFCGLNQSLP